MKQQIIELHIEDLTDLGQGFAHYDGKAVFVPFTMKGEEVEAKIVKKIKGVLIAIPQRFIKQNPDRVEAICKHFGNCGGCALQHLNANDYHQFKKQRAMEAIKKAGFGEDILKEVIHAGPYSRRRVAWTVKQGRLGFFKAQSHFFVPIDECHTITKPLLDVFHSFPKLESLSPVQDEVMAVEADTGIDILIKARQEISLRDMETLKNYAESQDIARISWRYKGIRPIIEQKIVAMKFGEVEVPLTSGSFTQPTRKGQEAITQFVLKYLEKYNPILDLFSGIGTYSFPLARNAKIHAIEGDQEMVESLLKATARYGYNNITAEKRDIMQNPFPAMNIKDYEAAVINPPRAGALEQTIEIARARIPHVVMVSCNPATFTRDAKILKDSGYDMKSAIAIDQFPWSSHLEILAYLSI